MYFEQFYLGCLAHASYMIGSGGVAAVVDPQRDVDIYLEAARQHGLRIAYVIETHLHADFVSGHRELAEHTGAVIVLGKGSGARFHHLPVATGDELHFGNCVLRFLSTPGHTIESISVVVVDFESSHQPAAVLTGDTLFVGDAGRPDLSESHTPQELAGMLYDSLFDRLLKLPDSVRVYPAHGAGSLCGKQLGHERYSTIGRERVSNYALQAKSRDAFVRMMTTDLPARPEYFLRDVELNRRGAVSLDDLPPPRPLSPREVIDCQARGAIVLDTRPVIEFAAAHVPGSIHIGLSGQYASWAARILGLDAGLVIVSSSPEQVRESQVRLARVGIEIVLGYLDGGIVSWVRSGETIRYVPQVTVEHLHQWTLAGDGEPQVLDVRNPAEWSQGYLQVALRIPLDELKQKLGDLDGSRTIAVHCQGGYRSSIATSILRREGFEDVANITGGFEAWKAAGLPYATCRP